MKIIISPAKKMRADTDGVAWESLPEFIDKTESILDCLREKSYEELKKLWKCNDSIANVNHERVRVMNLKSSLTPAIFAYEGIQYQYMAPSVFTDSELAYVQSHLRILSGFYGVLRPLDGVTPYRMEMQTKLAVDGKKDLYDFWGDSIANELVNNNDCIVNLASKEYSICVSKHIPDSMPFVTCVFGEEINGKVVEKGTMCKMARGEMVRFMAENNISCIEDIKRFERLNYIFSEKHSTPSFYVFIKQAARKEREDY